MASRFLAGGRSALALALLVVAARGVAAVEAAGEGVALESGHAHNDYRHARPLWDALEHGFTSVEADIFLVDGQLLVGHDEEELRPGRTLESLYLAPLAERVRRNGGQVHREGRRFFLLIDVKSDAEETYSHLRRVLAQYAEIITVVNNGKLRLGPVTVVVTGNWPRSEAAQAEPRYAGFDGRIADLSSDAPSHLMPMISDKWGDHFTWEGRGEMPTDEKERLKEIVRQAHAAGRVVRFWATPEKEPVWRELRAAGVDLINTDELARLATFLRESEGLPGR